MEERGEVLLNQLAQKQTQNLRSLQLLLALSLLLGVSACSQMEAFDSTLRLGPTSKPTGWQSPVPMDRAALGEGFLDTATALGFANVTTYPTNTLVTSGTVSQSFLAHRLVRAGDRALWVGSLLTGFSAPLPASEVYGRVFTPSLLRDASFSGSAGWASVGTSFLRLDAGLATDRFDQVFLGAARDGTALSLFSSYSALNGGSTTAFQSAEFSESGGSLAAGFGAWGNFRTGSAVTIPRSAYPGGNYSGSTNQPGLGRISELVWDRDGQAYVSFVSAGDFREARLQRYTPLDGWENSTQALGRRVEQVALLEDGYGITALWRTRFTAANQLAAGGSQSCALNNGKIRCWGRRNQGALGRSTTCGATEVPATYPATASRSAQVDCLSDWDVTAISSGADHTCAIAENEAQAVRVYCWGKNDQGQLGVDTTGASRTVPQHVSTLPAGYTPIAISASGDSTCVTLENSVAVSDDQVACWGEMEGGFSPALQSPLSERSNATSRRLGQVSLGEMDVGGVRRTSACVIESMSATSNSVICWGSNTYGQLGRTAGALTGPYNLSSAAASAANGVGPFDFGSAASLLVVQEIAVSGTFSCMRVKPVTANQEKVYCWGMNGDGQLGNGVDRVNTHLPTQVAIPQGVQSLAVSQTQGCAVLLDQTVDCWGGTTTDPDPEIPVPLSQAERILTLAGGAAHFCAIDSSQRVLCWGDNGYGQVGDAVGVGLDTEAPVAVTRPFDCGSGKCLFAAWSEDGDFSQASLLAESVESFAAAADSKGNVLTVMVREDSTVDSDDCWDEAPQCQYRVYAAARNLLGDWLTPSRIDSTFTSVLTTLYQDGATKGGNDFPSPAVVALGSDQFLAAFSITDVTSLSARTHTLYVRTYQAGAGWVEGMTEIESQTLAGVQTHLYRSVNDLRFFGDGEGSALLAVHGVIPGALDSIAAFRAFGYRVYRYRASAWQDLATPLTSTGLGFSSCVTTHPACHGMQLEGAIFPGGDAVVVFPAPDPEDTTRIRLYSSEYRGVKK